MSKYIQSMFKVLSKIGLIYESNLIHKKTFKGISFKSYIMKLSVCIRKNSLIVVTKMKKMFCFTVPLFFEFNKYFLLGFSYISLLGTLNRSDVKCTKVRLWIEFLNVEVAKACSGKFFWVTTFLWKSNL